MRVLHVYRTYFPDTQGGLEEVVRQICSNSKPLGVESRVFSLSTAQDLGPIKRDEAEVFRAKLTLEVASCGMSISAFSVFSKLVKWADIVHYHFPWPFADMLHFLCKVKKPTLLTYHSDIVRQRFLNVIYTPLMRQFLGSVDKIICTSPNYFATSEILLEFEDKINIIPIGINESTYPVPEPSYMQAVQQKYDQEFFMFVGVLRYYKGLHILLEAIQNAPFSVVIVGSGPTEAALKQQADDLGLTNVIFTGYLPDADKISLLKLCRGVVFPSYMRTEAFGVTLLEGAMYGKPLISTEVGSGTSHVNIDGQTGIVVPPGSHKALRAALDILWHQPETAARMGRNARARYETLFNGTLMGGRYTSLYETLHPQRAAG